MDPNIDAALRRHSGVFATADALAAGLDRNAVIARVRAGEWKRVRYGIYTTSTLWRHNELAGSLHVLECAAVVRRLTVMMEADGVTPTGLTLRLTDAWLS